MKYLIVGLGNIGAEYANTRHNIGFMVADKLAADAKVSFTLQRHAFVTEFRHKGRIINVIKPTTYMNLSGKALSYWMQQLNIELENVLVITDDLDLDFGVLRLKPKGSGGSHNGVNHIIEVLGTSEFARLRFGIGSNFPRGRQVEYVLGPFSAEDNKTLDEKIELAAEITLSFTTSGIQRTMNAYNKK